MPVKLNLENIKVPFYIYLSGYCPTEDPHKEAIERAYLLERTLKGVCRKVKKIVTVMLENEFLMYLHYLFQQ